MAFIEAVHSVQTMPIRTAGIIQNKRIFVKNRHFFPWRYFVRVAFFSILALFFASI